MVTLNMLILEMSVKYLGIGQHARCLVIPLPSVDQFVACLSLYRADETQHENEDQVLRPGLRSNVSEVVPFKFYVIAHETQRPDPGESARSHACIQRNEEPAIVEEFSLALR